MREDNTVEPVVEAIPSSGAILREARQKYGLSEEDVAAELNLSVSHIQALEDDRFQELPGETYIRGYLKAYARLVGTEASAVLKNFNQQENAAITGIRPAIRETRRGDRHMKLLSILVIVILGGLMFMWWQGREPSSFIPLKVLETFSPDQAGNRPDEIPSGQSEKQESEMGAQQPAGAEKPVASNADNPGVDTAGEPAVATVQPTIPVDASIGTDATTTPAAGMPVIQPVIETMTGAEVESETLEPPGDEQPAQSVTGAGTQAGGSPATQQALAPAESVQATADSGADNAADAAPIPAQIVNKKKPIASSEASSGEAVQEVKLQVSATSWVDLRDANGQRLVYENVDEGSAVAVRGKPPFSVFLGNAEAVQIEYGGEAFDFSPYTNGIYARFELGAE